MGPYPAARYMGTRPAGFHIKGGCTQCSAGSGSGCSRWGEMLKGLGSQEMDPKEPEPKGRAPPSSGHPSFKGRGEPCPRGCGRERMREGGDVVPRDAGQRGGSTQGCRTEGMSYPGMQEGGDVVPRDTIGSPLTSCFLRIRMPLLCHYEESQGVYNIFSTGCSGFPSHFGLQVLLSPKKGLLDLCVEKPAFALGFPG